MRRRPPDDAVPAPLAVFDPRDWPGPSVRDSYHLWRAARRRYSDAYGWPGGPLEQLAAESGVRAALDGRRLLFFFRSDAELVAIADEMERRYGRRPTIAKRRQPVTARRKEKPR